MLDILKKTLFAGLGATVISAERLRAKLDELVDKGKISAKEAQEMTGKIMDEGRKEFEQSGQRVADLVDELMRKANFARQKDFAALVERVKKLEVSVFGSAEEEAPEETPVAEDTKPAAEESGK